MPKHRTRGLFKGTKEKPAPLSLDQEKICGALCRTRRNRYDLSLRQRMCKNHPIVGRMRCRLHGGLSTGARTPEGKARSIAAMVEGRRRWIEAHQVEA